jgi:hypothetical protein
LFFWADIGGFWITGFGGLSKVLLALAELFTTGTAGTGFDVCCLEGEMVALFGAINLVALMKMLPWCMGTDAFRSTVSSHAVYFPIVVKKRK